MPNSFIQRKASQKEKMASILFWVFVIIFSLTALLALISLVNIIFVVGMSDQAIPKENKDMIERFTWALWGAVLSQVAAGVYALYLDLFRLSTAREVTDISNSLTEIIDGLELDEKISQDIASELRVQYSDSLGISGSAKS
jgi:hypothetical protein